MLIETHLQGMKHNTQLQKAPKTALIYEEAKAAALNIVGCLAPHCIKIDIAGSIRRQKGLVRDIEIVCLPKETIMVNLFGEAAQSVRCFEFIKQVKSLGLIIKGSPDGRYAQVMLKQQMKLDLFMPVGRDYYRQLAMRTGPAEFSHKVIARGWLKLGWAGTDEGLKKIEDCQQTIGSTGTKKWKVVNKNGKIPPAWQSEEDFFRWLNLKWIPPHERSAQ